MGSLTVRTAAIVLVVMLFVGLIAVTVISRQTEQMMLEVTKQQLYAWLRPLLQELQDQDGDIFQLFSTQRMSENNPSVFVTMVEYLDVTASPQVLWSIPDLAHYLPTIDFTMPAERGQLRIHVWWPESSAVQRLHQRLVWMMLTLAIMAALTAFFANLWAVRPLYRLIARGTQLTNGVFDQSIDIEGCLEVTTLSQVLEQVRLRFRQLVSGAITQAMIWEGNLELFPVSQLLIMLKFTSQTGVLVIMSNGGLGRIYVAEGRIRGAAYKEQSGFRAFYALFLLDRGTFKFNAKMKPFEDELQTASWYSTLLYAARRVHSLQFIEQYIPDMRFVASKATLGSEAKQVQKALTPEEWQLFEVIDGEQNVRQLARKLQWTPETVQRYLYRFAVIGLIESQFSMIGKPPPQNVISLWARAAMYKKNGGN